MSPPPSVTHAAAVEEWPVLFFEQLHNSPTRKNKNKKKKEKQITTFSYLLFNSNTCNKNQKKKQMYDN